MAVLLDTPLLKIDSVTNNRWERKIITLSEEQLAIIEKLKNKNIQ